jgi:hypothetical protein
LKCVKMFNDEEDESFESSTDSGSDSEPEFKDTAKPDSDDEGPLTPYSQHPSEFPSLFTPLRGGILVRC